MWKYEGEGEGKNLKSGVRGKIPIPFNFLYSLIKKILFIVRLKERCYTEQNFKHSFSPLNTVKINLSQHTDKKVNYQEAMLSIRFLRYKEMTVAIRNIQIII